MKNSVSFYIFSLITLGSFHSLTVQAGLDDKQDPSIPCPPGYKYLEPNPFQARNWDVCIALDVHEMANVTLSVRTDCLEKNSALVRQEKNPEANICFTIEEGGADIKFLVTRDTTKETSVSKGQFRVDLAPDLSIQCPDMGMIISLTNVYCLEDIETVYSLDLLEEETENYLGTLLECLDPESAQTIANAYERYLDFAYYSNDSISLQRKLPEKGSEDTRVARKQQNLNPDSGPETCKDIENRIKEMTGVTN